MTKHYLFLREHVVELRRKAGILAKRSTNDYFLLSVQGVHPVRVGLCLRKFFEKSLDLQIESKTIRMLYETEMDEALENGSITFAERQAVMRSSGHCEATVKKFYTPKRRQDCASTTTSFFPSPTSLLLHFFFTVVPIQRRQRMP